MPESARLFSALVPPDHVVMSLRAELARHPRGAGSRRLRWSGSAQWHVTLGFYGLDDVQARTTWLRERLAGVRTPTLRLAGAGTFEGVLWAGVFGSGLTELADAARPPGDDREFHAHLTLARGRAPRVLAAWERLLAGYAGPEWTATEAVLMRSDPAGAAGQGPVYSVVGRFPLSRAAGENAP